MMLWGINLSYLIKVAQPIDNLIYNVHKQVKMKWIIYYGDGSTWSDMDGWPEDSPHFNVQVVVVRDQDVGRRLIFGHAWYLFKDDLWFGVDDTASLIIQFLQDADKIRAVRAGMIVSPEAFKKIFDMAKTDPDFSVKSGYARGEGRL